MVPMRRALRLVLDGKAEIVESDPGRLVRSERLTLPRPAVIRLMKFIHVPRRFRRQVTNTFLFARDRYRCQYCGRTQVELSDLPPDIQSASEGEPLFHGLAGLLPTCGRLLDLSRHQLRLRIAIKESRASTPKTHMLAIQNILGQFVFPPPTFGTLCIVRAGAHT